MVLNSRLPSTTQILEKKINKRWWKIEEMLKLILHVGDELSDQVETNKLVEQQSEKNFLWK